MSDYFDMTEQARRLQKPKRKRDRKLLDEVKKRVCVICFQHPGDPYNPIDPSHIRSQGSGGDDVPENVLPMCRRHHQEWHQYGAFNFCSIYPYFFQYISELGWYFDGHRLRHPKLEKGDA